MASVAQEVARAAQLLLDRARAEAKTLATPVFNILGFGAKGDGLTDDTAAIQAAVDAASEAGGGVVYVPSGVFRCCNVMLKSNVHITGAGFSSVLKLIDGVGPGSHVLQCGHNYNPAKNVQVSDLKIDGNRTAIGLADVQMHGLAVMGNTENIRVSKVWFHDTCGDGIWTTSDGALSWPGVPQHVTIEGCRFTNTGRQDIAIIMGWDIAIVGNTGDGTLDVEPVGEPGLCRRVTITGNTTKRLHVTNVGYKRSQFSISGNTVAEQCVIWQCGGVTFTGNSVFGLTRLSEVSDVVVEGNSLKALAIYPTATTFNNRVTVVGNSIVNEDNGPDDPQVNFADGGATVYIWRTRHLLFARNLITSPKLHGIRIDGGCEDLHIEGNNIVDPDGTTNNRGVMHLVSHENKDLMLVGNLIKGFAVGIYSDGANRTDHGRIAGNIIEARTQQLDLHVWDNLTIESNNFVGDATSLLAALNNVTVKGNVFKNTTTVLQLLLYSGCSGVVQEDNSFRFAGAGTVDFYNSANVYVRDRFTSIDGARFTGTTTILPGSIVYTGETNRLGRAYNGSTWVDHSF